MLQIHRGAPPGQRDMHSPPVHSRRAHPLLQGHSFFGRSGPTFPAHLSCLRQGQTRTTSARARAHTNGNKGNHDGMYKGVGKANGPSSCGPVKGYQKGDGRSGGKDPSWQVLHLRWHFARDCPKGGGKGGFRALEALETWEEPPLAEHVCVLSSLREAPPKDSKCRKN